MTQHFRAVVIGCGALGAAATYWLSRSLGSDVLAVDQYGPEQVRGAFADHSRVIRHAYTRTEYTSLTAAAYQSWGVVEEATGLDLLHKTGGLIIAEHDTAGSVFVEESAEAMGRQNTPFELLDAAQVQSRWPQWRLTSRHHALFDTEAGLIDIRRATQAHVALARANGATVRTDAAVTAVEESATGVRVTAGGETVTADRVVFAGGSWNPLLLEMVGVELPITLTEEQITYFATPHVKDFHPSRFPVYGFINSDDLLYYGFPVYGEVATKAGIDGAGPVVTNETRSYTPDRERVEKVRDFLQRYLPGADGPELYSRACCYDFPPDRDFVLDRVPGSQRIVIGVGAGHAAKFAALVGRILSDLTVKDTTGFEIKAFRADRAATTGPVRHNSM